MAIKTTLENVIQTQDGRNEYACYDAVVTAGEINRLFKTGFLKLDTEHQRGVDAVTQKQVIDLEKVERWAEQLIKGEAYFGQLSWNFRREETTLEYDPQSRTLTIGAGAATIPDSYHRHVAIVKAAESADKGSGFDLSRKFSVKIYNVPIEAENRIFYAMNQEGQKADPTRSKWLHRVGVTKLAAALVEGSPHLRENVDTVRDRLSKRNPRLCAFNTLSRAFEDHWPDVNDEDKPSFDMEVEYLLRYWDKLVQVRPELGKLDLRRRQSVREISLVDSALAITAYIALAKVLKEGGIGLAALERLSTQVESSDNGKRVDFFSRENPTWEKIGVLVPVTKRNGSKALNLRNAKEPRRAMLTTISGLVTGDNEAGRKKEENRAETAFKLA